eukprot:TRINITY_DN9420_c0_g2_i1.p1 TRINITY_DN9420_c0_g2~~TRINITY_DN9420_c0_g2_i1.p1  ORF type:complete len:652 (+),score=43.97 TRINITY_DN9420_c0_g2_i1:68-2023(+)
MKKINFIILLLLSSILCRAQFLMPLNNQRHVDSLNAILNGKQPDSLKAVVDFSLARFWAKEGDLKKVNFYLSQGKKLINRSRYLEGLYLYARGMIYFNTNDNLSSKKYLIRADSAFASGKTKNSYNARAKLWYNYALLLERENNYTGALNITLTKMVPMAKLAGNQIPVGSAYQFIANMLDKLGQSEKAAEYFQKSIITLENTPVDSTVLVQLYITSARNSMNLNRLADAKLSLDKAKLVFANNKKSTLYIYYCEFQSYYYLRLKEYSKSLFILNEGIGIAEKLNLNREKKDLLCQKYNILNDQGKHEEAKNIISQVIKIDDKGLVFLEDRVLHYKQAYETYDALKNLPEAFKWLKKYTSLRDSANNAKLKEELNILEIKFKTAENQKKIAELNTANQKANLSAKNSHLLNWLLGVVSLLILSVFIFGFYYYRNQKKIATQREEIRLSNAMLQGQETERHRVARDLHDGLGNVLAVVKFNLWQFAKEKPAAELDEIINQVDHSVSELRRISHNMMPEMLLNIGLEAALKDLCESLNSDELEIDCQLIHIKNNIPQQTQVSIYRIIQELLTNVVKHAEAKNAFLQCTQHKNAFFITLEDDGKGFNNPEQRDKTGIGLSNIKSRIAYLNGKMEIGKRINQFGTSINIELNVKA